MQNDLDNQPNQPNASQWQLNAITQALGELSLTITDSLTVGRGSDNDLVLGSKQVSRNHAKLYVQNGQLYVEDLASSNGTYVNEVAVTPNQSTSIKPHDKVAFASFEFQAQPLQVADNAVTTSETLINQESNEVPTNELPINEMSTNEVPNTDLPIQETSSTQTSPAPVESKIATSSASAPDAPVAQATQSPVSLENPIKDDVQVQPSTSQVQPTVKQTSTLDGLEKNEPIRAQVETQTKPADSTQSSPPALSTASVEKTPQTDSSVSVDSKLQEKTSQPIKSKAEAPVNPLDTSLDIIHSTEEKENLQPHKPDESKPKQDERAMPIKQTPEVETKTSSKTTQKATDVETYKSEDSLSHAPVGEDKTTKTTLQQEADPDVLRAKQVATSQFAPQENNDIGTNHNKAVDQAATNPATHPEQRADKKASGGWFIWVFLLIIVIAIVVWIVRGGQSF